MSGSLALSLRNIYETLAISAPTVVDALAHRVTKATCDERLDRWSRACVRNARITLQVTGREHLAGGQTFLVMSNHQSIYDIPVVFQAVGPNLRMVAKKELFHVPVFGGALEASGFIAIDRTNRHSALKSLERARALLGSGTHVWIAPEGTRSLTGALLPFKKGAFYLAFESGLPILPVTVSGTRDVLPAHGLLSRRGKTVRVTIHAPLDPRGYSGRGRTGRNELMDTVRCLIETAL